MPLPVPVDLDAQYRAMREEAGVLERAGRAVLGIEGPGGADYLQSQVTNDVLALGDGEGCYAALLDRKGHMRGDMRILRISDDELLLDTEPVAREAVSGHLRTYLLGYDARISDGDGPAVLSVIGPAAATAVGVEGLGPEHAHRPVFVGEVACRAVATDVGVDLFCPAESLEAVGSRLGEAGVPPVTEEAAEIVRVESGRPRFGREMNERTIPQEAGINERAVSFEKGCYIGQETVARLHYKGRPNRHLRGLRLTGPVEAGTPLELGEREVGTVGTACLSPARGWIGLAIVRREAEPGAVLRAGDEKAEVLEPGELGG